MENNVPFKEKLDYYTRMRLLFSVKVKRTCFLVALVLLAQAPCFCAPVPQVESVSSHGCCPQTHTPLVAERLQSTCVHCDTIAQIPTMELSQSSHLDSAQPAYFVVYVFSTPKSFVFNIYPDYIVPPAHAPPVFISQARFIS